MNRREFLKELGTIGSAAGMLALFPWLEACTPAGREAVAGERARLGIIGTGSRAQFHINNLSTLPGARIVALCDDYAPHLEQAAALCPGAKMYTDYRRLLEDVDVDGVMICTPLNLHAVMSMDALAAGKHVFCEKAMAYTPEDCKAMYDAARASGRAMIVGQQRLFDPKYIRAMELVREGKIGQVVGIRNYWFRNNDWRREVPSPELERRINWRLYREFSRGLMTELACHQLQNGNWALGMIPESVSGHGGIVHWKDSREVYDTVSVVYAYPNGVNMTFESVIANKHFGMGEHILGSEGTIRLVDGRLYGEQPRQPSGIKQLVDQIGRGVFAAPAFAGTSWAVETASADPGTLVIPGAKANDGSSSVGAQNDGSLQIVEAFCHAVITGRQPEKVLEESYYASLLSLLGDQAMLTGSVVRVPEELKIDYMAF